MKWLAHGIGIGMAALLLVVLALTRWWVTEVKIVDIDLREVELAAPEEPPPPPEEEPPPEVPPPPSLSEVSEVPDPTRVPIPKAEVPLDVRMPVDTFFADVAPSPLPQPVVVRRPAPAPSRPAAPVRRPTPPPPPKAKSHYSMNELDSRPRLLRHGSAVFPSSLARRGVTSGTVTFEVELSQSGGVSVRRVVSSSHSELVGPARRVASGARFTRPTKNGKPVKAIMRWPITIRK